MVDSPLWNLLYGELIMKKDQLEERAAELEKQVRETIKERESYKEAYKSVNEQLSESRKVNDHYHKALCELAEVLAPMIGAVLLKEENFIKGISNIAYESAGEWGCDHYVECKHNPDEE